MLKKNNRLTSNAAFKATYFQRNCFSKAGVVLYLGKVKEDSVKPIKIGFVVSKKISKLAVRRNRIKRLLRESVRLKLKKPDFDFLNNFQSMIFTVKFDISEKSFKEVDFAVENILKSLKNKNI